MLTPTSTTCKNRSLPGRSSHSTSLPLRTWQISLQSHCLLASMSISSIYWELGMLEGVCYRNRWSNIPYYHQSLKNRPIPHTQTHNFLCISVTTKHMQYTLPEHSTAQTNDSINDRDTYIQLGDTYIHLIKLDRHYTIISPDTQLYHTAHLPISIPAMTCTLINWNPCAYIIQTSHLPIEHRSFTCYPLVP